MSFMDRVRETFSASKEETEPEAQRRIVDDQRHLQSIVGIPQARDFAHVDSQGDVHKFVADNGSRMNVDSKGQFYDGELRPIDREAASTYQRMTTEWQGQSHDDTRQLMDHLKQFTQPAIDQYVQEQKLGGLQNASPAQQDDLGERLQRRLGLAEDSASLAVIQQVMEAKNAHGVRHTPDEEMRQEYAIDTLRGKDGPNYMRESREEDFARKLAEPALEAFAAKNNVAVAQLTQEQVQQVGKEVSQQEQIPLATATAQVHYAHMQEQMEVRKRDDILEQAVGSTNAGHYTWKQNSGTIESYQHNTTGRFVHLDSDHRFYDQGRSPMEPTAALSHAENKPTAAPQNEMTSGRADTERDERAMRYQSTWEGKTDHTLPAGLTKNVFTEQLGSDEIAAHKELSARLMASGATPAQMKESLSALIDTWNQDKVNMGSANADEVHGKERWKHADAYIEQFTKQRFDSAERMSIKPEVAQAPLIEQSVSM